MKPSRFTEEQIIGILRGPEAGAKTADVCRKHGISSATFYKWKAAARCSQEYAFYLLNDFVGGGEQRLRHFQAERLCGRKINGQVELGWLFYREVGWLRPAQDFVIVIGSVPK